MPGRPTNLVNSRACSVIVPAEGAGEGLLFGYFPSCLSYFFFLPLSERRLDID